LSSTTPIVCGHWAALGLRLRPDLLALDSGCVWGGALTAVRLEDRAVFAQPCADRC
jgi:bis(5'-nucleosyl)-tetraphosphatase (symmetrical)